VLVAGETAQGAADAAAKLAGVKKVLLALQGRGSATRDEAIAAAYVAF
jgi:hypothetical protein